MPGTRAVTAARRLRRRRAHRARRRERDGPLPRAPRVQGRREVRDLPRRKRDRRAARRAAQRLHLARRRRLPRHLPRRGGDGRPPTCSPTSSADARVDGDELDRERGVVIQEINRSDDAPASVAAKLLDRAAFGDHPLGPRRARPGGAPARPSRREAILAFRERRWAPARGGAFLAGDLSSADDDRLGELFGRFPARAEHAGADPAPGFERRVARRPSARPTSRTCACTGARRSTRPTSRQRAALAVYSTLLGGSMGSRLFDEIREQRGLCYAIRSLRTPTPTPPTLERRPPGSTRRSARRPTGGSARSSPTWPRTGPREAEVERARAYAAGSTVLALESTSAVARRAASQKVTFGEIASPDEAIAALDAVTERRRARGRRAASRASPAVACVGPHAAVATSSSESRRRPLRRRPAAPAGWRVAGVRPLIREARPIEVGQSRVRPDDEAREASIPNRREPRATATAVPLVRSSDSPTRTSCTSRASRVARLRSDLRPPLHVRRTRWPTGSSAREARRRTRSRRPSSPSGAAARGTCPSAAASRTWVLAITHRRAIDVLRRNVVHLRRQQAASENEDRHLQDDRTEVEVVRREEAREVRAALEELPTAQRKVRRARVLRGLHAQRDRRDARGADGNGEGPDAARARRSFGRSSPETLA